MQVILTNLDKPLKYEGLTDGNISLHELKVVPG